MTRPGYILVARQMGKTNLLMHTKDVMEDERNIFTYIDFTSTFFETESECYDEIIDITLETHKNVFKKEAEIIEKRRNARGITTPREFTRDLRLLIDAVDKLVIILDEIDALVRMSFSDNVFALIRSHYFQRKNYPDMSKLSYLLSGVMEPKDIIKNPDISPFNIGQEIYVKDFTRQEFDTFLQKAGLAGKYSKDFYEKIFYWTCGHPRLTWDLCQIIEETGVSTTREIDEIVEKYYLATCDKAPIDGIRKLVANDADLRDMVLQLIYDMTDSLTADQRKKLYLGGIINFDAETIKFKNPILEKSLPLEWVKKQGNKEVDTQESLDKAERLIFIKKDYKSAQLVLETLFRTSDKGNKDDKILLLLGESLFRQYQNKKAISYLSQIDESSSLFPEARFKTAQNLYASESFNEALSVYKECLRLKEDRSYTNKVKLGMIEVISEMNDESLLQEAEGLIDEMLKGISGNPDEYHQSAMILYFSALIYQKKKDFNSAISALDSAIGYAQHDEQIVLYYYKYKCTTDEEKKDELIREIMGLMKNANSKPVLGDFDNSLAFSKYYTLLIFSEIILNYPQYVRIIEPLFKWFFERREDVYISICATLSKNKLPDTERFARLIIEQTKEAKLQPSEIALIEVMTIWSRLAHDATLINKLGSFCFDYINNYQPKTSLPEDLVRLLMFPLQDDVKAQKFQRVKQVVINALRWFGQAPDLPLLEEHYVMMYFYTAIVAFVDRNYNWFIDAGSKFLWRSEDFLERINSKTTLDISIDMLHSSRDLVFKMGTKFKEEFNNFRGDPYTLDNLGRNTRVVVYDHVHKKEIVVKLKNYMKEIQSGFFEIRSIDVV
jgi:tetratricopeptide (TPR) repeat protein